MSPLISQILLKMNDRVSGFHMTLLINDILTNSLYVYDFKELVTLVTGTGTGTAIVLALLISQ